MDQLLHALEMKAYWTVKCGKTKLYQLGNNQNEYMHGVVMDYDFALTLAYWTKRVDELMEIHKDALPHRPNMIT